ncbi:MAG TPA: DUF502 domain-containing protein [Polyangia bacterium]|nr:DUF502 domain-containing protein [Polyangia bacterium]
MFRRNLITGVLVTLPIAAALWIFVALARSVDEIFPDVWRPRLGGYPVPGLGLVAAFIIVFGVGVIARNFLGQRVLAWVDQGLEHIPVFGKTYGLLKQIVQSIFGKRGQAFRHAVLVRFPHENAWSVGFVTQHDPEIEYRLNRKIVAVYVPTTPNPTSGYYLFVPEEETIRLDLPVDQALKLVVTMGIVTTESGLIQLAELSGKPR